jgi:hypothetical protein
MQLQRYKKFLDLQAERGKSLDWDEKKPQNKKSPKILGSYLKISYLCRSNINKDES